MALTNAASGTQTTIVGTEHTLATLTTSHTFVLVTDLNAMVAGDTTELRVYTKALSGGTERQAYYFRYDGAQATPIKYELPIPADISYKATLKQTTGSARSVPWKVLSVD